MRVTGDEVKEALAKAKDEALSVCRFLPSVIKVAMDSGTQMIAFDVVRWMRDNGFKPISVIIKHPQSIGRVKRYHRTMKEEVYCEAIQ
jgi:hypothetical protein